MFQLSVGNGNCAVAVDRVNVAVTNRNTAPTANAGPDQVVPEGVWVVLDGSALLQRGPQRVVAAGRELRLQRSRLAHHRHLVRHETGVLQHLHAHAQLLRRLLVSVAEVERFAVARRGLQLAAALAFL